VSAKRFVEELEKYQSVAFDSSADGLRTAIFCFHDLLRAEFSQGFAHIHRNTAWEYLSFKDFQERLFFEERRSTAQCGGIDHQMIFVHQSGLNKRRGKRSAAVGNNVFALLFFNSWMTRMKFPLATLVLFHPPRICADRSSVFEKTIFRVFVICRART
jgi:hypothetical protein